MGKSRWFNLLWLLPIGFVLLIVAIAAAKGLRNVGSVQRFIAAHPGTVASSAPPHTAALPIWVGVQHFFNLFLLIFIIRSGLQILTDHPRLYWTRHSTPGRDWFRIQKPVPPDPLWTAKQDSISLPGQVGLPGLRHSIGLARWWHLGVDTLWLINGIVFYILRVHHRGVATDSADQLVGVPQCRLDPDPVPVVDVADRVDERDL